MAFWPHDSNAANYERETLDALYPGMANVVNPKLIKISTPFGKRGTLWTEFQRRASLPFPVFQVTTREMNPTIEPAELEMYREQDDSKYRREFMAEFSEDINAWIDTEILYRCVVPGRKESPPEPGVYYFAAIDPAFRHDDFALTIAHRDSEGTVVLDLLVRWRGSKKISVCWGLTKCTTRSNIIANDMEFTSSTATNTALQLFKKNCYSSGFTTKKKHLAHARVPRFSAI